MFKMFCINESIQPLIFLSHVKHIKLDRFLLLDLTNKIETHMKFQVKLTSTPTERMTNQSKLQLLLDIIQ
jgi:hypothetical protein